jgi:predicted TIM-barrel fold metal-dependent hydrolase
MTTPITRRILLQTGAAAGLSAVTGCTRPQKTTSTNPAGDLHADWIDAHVHVWTDDLAAYPLAPGVRKEQMNPPRFTPQDLFAQCEPVGVRRINLIQMSWYLYDNRYMLDVIRQYPGRFAGTAIIDPTSPDLPGQMRRLSDAGVRAFRIYPSLAGRKSTDWLQPEGYTTMFRAGADLNLAMSCLINPPDLPELDRMCRRFPETPIIIDHLCRVGINGRVDSAELDALCRMSRHRRIMVKVGAFYALGTGKPPYDDLQPMIRQVVEAFGPQRCMWETDSPWEVVRGSYAASLTLIRDRCTSLPPENKRHIPRPTAEDFLFSPR